MRSVPMRMHVAMLNRARWKKLRRLFLHLVQSKGIQAFSHVTHVLTMSNCRSTKLPTYIHSLLISSNYQLLQTLFFFILYAKYSFFWHPSCVYTWWFWHHSRRSTEICKHFCCSLILHCNLWGLFSYNCCECINLTNWLPSYLFLYSSWALLLYFASYMNVN